MRPSFGAGWGRRRRRTGRSMVPARGDVRANRGRLSAEPESLLPSAPAAERWTASDRPRGLDVPQAEPVPVHPRRRPPRSSRSARRLRWPARTTTTATTMTARPGGPGAVVEQRRLQRFERSRERRAAGRRGNGCRWHRARPGAGRRASRAGVRSPGADGHGWRRAPSRAPSPGLTAARVASFELLLLGDATRVPLTGRVTLGRSPASTVVLHDLSVSRRHALIRLGDDGEPVI